MHKVVVKEAEINGRKIKLETGKLANMAEAAVVTSIGDTVVLVTVATKPVTDDPGYFPLSVEYVEKYYAGGRITGQKFIKREGKPSEKSVLSGRAIDRSIRPLFPKDFRNEVQIIATVLSYDGVNDPVMAGFIGASAALSISSLPFLGPLGATRLGAKDGQLVVDPDMEDIDHLDMELLVAVTREKVAMIEAEAKEVTEDFMFDAIKTAFDKSQPVIDLIDAFTKEAGKEKIEVKPLAEQLDEALLKEVKKVAHEKIEAALFDKEHAWHEATGDMIKQELAKSYADQLTSVQVAGIFDKVAKEIMNDTILNKKKRVDGRAMDEVRPIIAETGILPRTHGSAVFQRGDTQVLAIATLGPLSLAQTLEGMEGEGSKRFMHHYNMGINPFSVGEVKRLGSPNRRDIGHGDLVERSIKPVLPTEEEFPYAIRVVSEVMAANASTSMASTCATTLALLNSGVPVKPVAGIALGLLSNDKTFQVITDMRATEDFYGEMDFKVAGTVNGITGIQMDTKLTGLSFEIVKEALVQGKKARELILKKIIEVAPQEAELSQYAPKISVTHIKPEEIGMLIGPGGKNINGIIARTGAQIDIEDDGTVMISAMDQASIDSALSAVNGMFATVSVGEEYDGKVVRLAPFGAFVEILPGKDGLVHVSQMAPGRVERPEDIVEEGQTVHVRVTDVDQQGKIALSMLFGSDIKPESEGRPQRSNRFGDRDRGGRPGDRGRRDDRGGRGGFDRNRGGGGGRRGGFGR